MAARRALLASVAFVVVLLGACISSTNVTNIANPDAGIGTSSGGGGSDSGDSASAFVGTWTCTGSTTLAAQSGSNADTNTDVIVANSDGTLTDTWSGAGGTCSAKFTVSGSTATVVSGQSCPVQQDGYAGSAINTGTFTVSGSTASITSTFAVTQTSGGAASTLTYSATCTKTSGGGDSGAPPSDSGGANDAGGGNAVSGSVDGVTLTINHATGFYTSSAGGGAIAGFIFSNNTDDCSRMQSGSSGWAPGETVLAVEVSESGVSAVAPGTYAVGSDDASAPQAGALFGSFDAQCTVTPPKPTGDTAASGSITITSASSTNIAGTFTLTFPGGALTGTFDVPVCNLGPDAGLNATTCTSSANNCCG
jgi:hypothetical protein